MDDNNKADLTKLTNSQSTGKSVSERFQHQIKVSVANAMCPKGYKKQDYLSLDKYRLFRDNSWTKDWRDFNSYILFNSPLHNQIILAFRIEFIFALANLHLGGEFEKQEVVRNCISVVEKKVLSEFCQRIVLQLANHFEVVEGWQESLQSSHVEMIYKKIPMQKYYEARFFFNSKVDLNSNATDVLIACLFTKQNPMS